MSISLESISSGKKLAAPKVLIYGVDGIGKSTFGAEAPDSIFIPTENRLGHINCNSFPLCKTWQELIDTIAVLCREDHSYKWVVVDSLDWAERLAHKKICEEHGETSIQSNRQGSDLSFGRGYKLANQVMTELRVALDWLNIEKNIGIILTCHAEIENFGNPQGDSYDHFVPNVHKHVRETFQHWADCIFFANYKTLVREEGQGFNKKNKAVGEGERLMFTEERPSFKAKNSYNLPPVMPLSFAEFDKKFNEFKEN